jgi:hypothetical protein
MRISAKARRFLEISAKVAILVVAIIVVRISSGRDGNPSSNWSGGPGYLAKHTPPLTYGNDLISCDPFGNTLDGAHRAQEMLTFLRAWNIVRPLFLNALTSHELFPRMLAIPCRRFTRIMISQRS